MKEEEGDKDRAEGDVADGSRHIVKYRNESLYVNIFPEERELFFSSVLEQNKSGLLLGAELNMVSRMVTLAWKGSSTEKVIQQLERSSAVNWDLPGILARLLTKEENL